MVKKISALLVVSAVLLCACNRPQSAPPPAGQLLAAVDTTSATVTPAAPSRSLSLFAVGDIMTDRNVGKQIRESSCAYVIGELAPELQRADIAFANLESPLSTVGPHDPSNCCFRAEPGTVKVLTEAGIDIVSLANNHTLNAGREGILQTMDNLDQAGIRYAGCARDRAKATWPRVLERNGLKVAFLAFTDLDFEHGSYAKVPGDLAAHQALIRSVKNKSDLVVVSYHWGQEYYEAPTDRQKEVAHAVVEAGADVVLGHHPHMLEGIEIYRDRPILYSMGNFVFDQRPGLRMESALFKLFYAEGKGWTIKVVPVWIPRSRMGPEYPGPEQRDSILTRFTGYCEKLGTPVKRLSGVLVIDVPPAAPTATAAPAPAGSL